MKKIKSTLHTVLNTLKGKIPVEKKITTKTGRVYFRLDETAIKKKFDVSDIVFEGHTKKMALVLKEDGSRTISFRQDGSKTKGLIDLKDAKTKDAFKNCSITIQIYEDVIVVEGTPLTDSMVEQAKNIIPLNVVNVSRQQKQIVIQRSNLDTLTMRKASGDYVAAGQMGFLDLLSCETVSSISSAIASSSSIPLSSNTMKKGINDAIKVATLFSGMGGLDLAFKQAGSYELIFALDKGFYKETKKNIQLYGEDACSAVGKDHIETYKHNIGDHIVDADFLEYPIEKFPEADVYVAGIPCIELSSVSPDRNNFVMLTKFVNKFIEVIKKAKDSCKVFVIENSDNLITAGRKFLDQIRRELPWFEITENAVDAADFGSAQHRKRAIIIGSVIGKISLTPPTVKPVSTVRTAFEGLTNDIPNQDPSIYCSSSRKDTVERMKYVPQGGNWQDIPEELRTRGKFANYHRRLHLDQKSIAIVNIRKSIITHPTEHRGLSIRECLRLFDLPDTFVCKGDLASMQQMVCNSVPLALGKAIAKTIKKTFDKLSNAPLLGKGLVQLQL